MTLKFFQVASQLISNSLFHILFVTLNFFRVASQLVPVFRILRIKLDVFRVRVDCIRVSSFHTFIPVWIGFSCLHF